VLANGAKSSAPRRNSGSRTPLPARFLRALERLDQLLEAFANHVLLAFHLLQRAPGAAGFLLRLLGGGEVVLELLVLGLQRLEALPGATRLFLRLARRSEIALELLVLGLQ
jgi:hypothetical protein